MSEEIRLTVATDLPPLSVEEIADLGRALGREAVRFVADLYDSLPVETRARIERFAVALEHLETDKGLEGRVLRELRAQFAEVEAASPDTNGLDRWLMMLDRIDMGRLFIVVFGYAEHLDAKRRAPVDAKADQKQARIRRAAELKHKGMSTAGIAQQMAAEGAIKGEADPTRTVRRWLREAESRTDRDMSDVT